MSKMTDTEASNLMIAASLITEAGGTLSDEMVKQLVEYYGVPTPEEFARGVPFPERIE